MSGTTSTFYKFEDAFGWRNGGGFNGFRSIIRTSEASDTRTEMKFMFQPVAGLFPFSTKIFDESTGLTLTTTEAIDGVSLIGTLMRRHRSYVLSSVVTDGLSGVIATTSYIQDQSSGNLQSKTTTIPGVMTRTEAYVFGTYGPLYPWGYANRMTKLTTTTTRPNTPPIVEQQQWEYDAYTGALTLERKHALTPAPVIHEILARTPRGEVLQEQTYYAGLNADDYARIDYEYDFWHLGPVRTTTRWNSPDGFVDLVERGERTHFQSGPDFVIAADGLRVIMEYDGFGRLVRSSAPYADGQFRYWITTTRAWDALSVPNGSYYVQVVDPGAPKVREYFDVLGRSLEKWSQAVNGDFLCTRTIYDERGRVAREREPRFLLGGNAFWTDHTYDDLDRLLTTSHPIHGVTAFEYTYDGGHLTTTSTHTNNGRWSATTTDATGLTISEQDEGGKLIYEHDARGQVTKVTKAGVVLSQMTYDVYGERSSLMDLSAGFTSYNHDPYGRLISQYSANSELKTFYYDNLDRLVRTEEPEGVIDITYQDASDRVERSEGFGITHRYGYNDLGLLVEESLTDPEDGEVMREYAYDEYDRPRNTQYNGLLTVAYSYANGHLEGVRDPDLNISYWKALEADNFGRYIKYDLLDAEARRTYYGSHLVRDETDVPGLFDMRYTWDDHTGDLLERWDRIHQRKEEFQYDALDRLTQARVTRVNAVGTVLEQLSLNKFGYDGNLGATDGNLVRKEGVGVQPFYLGHAVTATVNGDWPQNNTAPPAYINQATQEVKYTSYHQPYQLVEHVDNQEQVLKITYGPDHHRVYSKHITQGGQWAGTRLFFGEHEVQRDATGRRDIIYVQGGVGLCAMIVIHQGQVQRYAVHTDHLGSIVLVTSGSEQVQVVAKQSFDPWGKPRDPATWTNAPLPALPTWLYRGYTGHEHLHTFALINMNGRLYDPANGRMLSADNYVQASLGTQGYNRYSYAVNNPLKFTDPSGEVIPIAIVAGAVIGGALNWAANGGELSMRGLGYFGVGAVAGGLSGGIGSGVSAALAGGGFLAGALSASAVTSTGFVAGAIAGSAGGLAGGFVSGFGNSINGGNSVHSAWHRGLRDGGLGAITGGIIGGIAGGIQSANNGGGFFETGRVSTIRIDRGLPPVSQEGLYDCLPAAGSSISGIPQSDLRLGFPGDGDIDNSLFAETLAARMGKMRGLRPAGSFSKKDIFKDFQAGADIIFSSDVPNGITRHATGLSSATQRTFDFARSAQNVRYRFTVMDPDGGVFRRLHDPLRSILISFQ